MPTSSGPSRVRLAYLVSHPIQYQAPLLRRIACEPDIDFKVFFGSDLSVRAYRDEGFGVEVAWDTPLLEGYASEFLPAVRDRRTISATSPISRGVYRKLRAADGSAAFDTLWVHGYGSVNALVGIAAAKALGIPVLLRAESWLADRPRTRAKLAAKAAFFSLLRGGIAATLPIGINNAAYWTHYLGAGVPQFAMPYAVDNAWFAARAGERISHLDALEELRRELAMEPGAAVILFASKLQERKQAHHLLLAYGEMVRGQAPEDQPYLVVVGDGEERGRLEAMASRSGLTRVRFAGFRNQTALPKFFALADVFVLPSREEPWGLVVNEAMASGCPVVVSSDVGCHRDLVTDGVEGFVYPQGDIPALADALRCVLADPAKARAMGVAARRRVQQCSVEADVRGLREALAWCTHRMRA